MRTPLEPDVTLPWLVRLRWLVIAGQTIALVVALAADLRITLPLFAGVIVIGVASNVWLARSAARMSVALAIDIAALTALLAASGGATNPFTTLYLVYLTLSAVVLSARWTTLLTLLAIGGYGLLFLLPRDAADPHAGHAGHAAGDGFGSHLQGMWVAFVLAAALTGFFVRRITRAIAAQREQIASLRETAARNARLAALTTLAAGAAHELGSPLATIGVAAHEASLGARRLPGAERVADDLGLILLELDRCQEILHRMAARANQTGEADEAFDAAELAARIREHLGEERAARIELRIASTFELRAPLDELVQSVVALVKNAFDAGGPEDRVVVELAADPREVRITIEDRGEGIPADVLARVGEPFFTTKQPGRGLGLGVFLARAFFESRGGALSIRSTPGEGTRATAVLPRPALGAA